MSNKTAAPKFIAKEWDASGAIHCYGTLTPRSLLVEVYINDKVDGQVLQSAVDKALERLPYYKQTLVRKKGLYYYADNDLPFEVTESKEARIIGDERSNYHFIDVTYYDKLIRFAMFHGMCDGLGLNRLIEAVVYHYFCLKDGKEYDSEGIYTDKIPFDEAELFDAFAKKSDVDPKELRKLVSGVKRFRLPELAEYKGPTIYRKPLKIKTEDLLKWCKSYGASPAPGLAAIIGKGIADVSTLKEDESVMTCVPTSLRKILNAEKTFKNCAAATFLSINPAEYQTKSVGEIAAEMRQEMKTQTGPEQSMLLGSSINFITHLGAKMPFYFLKNKVLAMPESRPQDTYTLDYVGSLRTNDYSDKISEVRYLNNDVYYGSMFVVLSETAGYFHINFTQTFEADRYYLSTLKVLDELGIPYEKGECDSYLNPEVILPKEQR
jgi:hypothetical protein